MNRFERWLAALAVTALAVAISYQWIDRPVSFFAHDHLAAFKLFGQLPKISEYLFLASALLFVFTGLRALMRLPLLPGQSVLLLCGVSLLISECIKDELKHVFGRTWPDTWTHNNPSLIHDGVYGFNWFHSGSAYNSFPSGHTAAICAVTSVLWFCYPRLRPFYVLAVAAVVGGLIGANYHFIGDIIAGAFIGLSTGWVTVVFVRALAGRSLLGLARQPSNRAARRGKTKLRA